MWKRGEIAPKEQFLLISTMFSVYFQESNYIFICEMWLFDLSFSLNSANLIWRDTDISKYFRESLRLRDNECRLYFVPGTVRASCYTDSSYYQLFHWHIHSTDRRETMERCCRIYR